MHKHTSTRTHKRIHKQTYQRAARDGQRVSELIDVHEGLEQHLMCVKGGAALRAVHGSHHRYELINDNRKNL